MDSADFMTVAEVAKTLGVTRQTVSKYISNKELNAIKMNKSYRVGVQDFQGFIANNSLIALPNPYIKKSRNCTLEYSNKSAEHEVLTTKQHGTLNAISSGHKLPYNKFIFGDNLHVLKALIPDLKGKIDLIYIDPPFGLGKDFIDIDSTHAYSDSLVDSEFLEFLRKRLIILRELMSPQGSIYLHIDKKIGHYVKIVMDEIFGYRNFINDITRIKCNPKNFSRNAYGNYSDMVLFYAKERDNNIWNDIKEDLDKDDIDKLFPKVHPKFGRYTTNPLHAPGETKDGDTGKVWMGMKPPKGRHWRYGREELTRLNEAGLIEWSDSGNPRKMVFAKEHKGTKVQDVWELKDKGLSYVDYPTQKNHELLERIILNSSNENSIVLDCFAGSGGTLHIADKLKRNWIGIDNSTQSLDVVKKVFKREKVKCNYFEYVPRD